MKITKIISLLMSFMMCFSIISPAFAASETFDEAVQKAEIKEKTDAEIKSKSELAKNKEASVSAKEVTSSGTINGMEYDIINDSYAEITEYIGSAKKVEIPSSINGYPVTNIGYAAFSDCETITSVSISDSVTAIGDYAFYNCWALKSIVIPDSVKTIGNDAFEYCMSLASVEIPDSVTSIGDKAFYECVALKNVTMGNSVKSIGASAFAHTSLASITIPESVTSIGSDAFDSYYTKIYGVSGSYAQSYAEENDISFIAVTLSTPTIAPITAAPTATPTATPIPQQTATPESYFEYRIVDNSYAEITGYTGTANKVIIPSEIGGYPVTRIGNDAFYDCTSLMSIEIPDSVTTIGSYAFYSCDKLVSVTLANNITTIGYGAFYSCDALTDVTIGNSVKNIGDGAFYDCTSLTNITIGNSVKSIGAKMFYGCSKLASITIPDSVTSIGKSAFSHCTSLTSIETGKNVTSIGDYAFYECWALKSVVISDSVKTIGDYAFCCPFYFETMNRYHITSLTDVTMGNSVESIGEYAFYGCFLLASITIPNSVKTIGDYAFYDCIRLKSIVIPDSVTSIGDCAFDHDDMYLDSSSLTDLTIGNGVTSIGVSAFAGSYNLKRLTIGNSVESIGASAFNWCYSLTSVVIPESVTSIGKGAFGGCDSLTSIEIPDSVTIIGDRAFYGCNNLERATIPNSVTSIGAEAFGDCSKLTIYCKNGSHAETYATENKIPTEIDMESCFEYTVVSDRYAEITEYIGKVSDVVIPSKIDGYRVTSIGEYAFSSNKILKSIVIPDSVINIGAGAFYSCTSLKNVEIGSNIKAIKAGTFYNCPALTSVTIPDSVTGIGKNQFTTCKNLTIYGINNSYARNYAESNNIPFVALVKVNSILYAGSSVAKYIKNNSKLPKYSTLDGDRIYMPELLGILAQFVIDTNTDFTSVALIERNDASFTETSYEQITGESLTKTQYVLLAQKVLEHIADNSTAPGYIQTDAGVLSYETMLKVFAEIASYARTEKKLPETIELQAWIKPLPTPPSGDMEDTSWYITFTDILSGANFVQSATKNTGVLPTFITVNSERLYRGTMLSIFVKTIVGIEHGKHSPVPVKEITMSATTVDETITSCTLTKAEYLILAERIAKSIDSAGALPKYCTTSYGTINTNNMIYVFSKVLDSYNTNGTLPETIDVQTWGTYNF